MDVMSPGLMAARVSADLPFAAGAGSGARPTRGASEGPNTTRAPTTAARMIRVMVVLRFIALIDVESIRCRVLLALATLRGVGEVLPDDSRLLLQPRRGDRA